MADEEATVQESQETEAQETDDLDAKIRERMEAMQAELDQKYKTEMSGLNRKNTELSKALEDERKARMSEKERAEYERTQYEESLKQRESEVKRAEQERLISERLADAKLPQSVRKLMTLPDSQESADEWAKMFDEAVKKEADARVNQKLLENRATPKAGDATPRGTLTEDEIGRMQASDIRNMTAEQFAEFRRRAGLS